MKNKVEAVYELREAAQEHGKAESRIERERTPQNIDRLLEAKERLELKTIEAIASCEHCGESHCDDASHTKTNVISVQFGREEEGTG